MPKLVTFFKHCYTLLTPRRLIVYSGICILSIYLYFAWKKHWLAGPYQRVEIYLPQQKATALVLLITPSDAHSKARSQVIHYATQHGAVLAWVQLGHYIKKYNPDKDACSDLTEDIGRVSKRVLKRADITTYVAPLLIGLDGSATFVQQVVASAVRGGIAGAIVMPQAANTPTSTSVSIPSCTTQNTQADLPQVHIEKNTAAIIQTLEPYLHSDQMHAAQLPLMEYPVKGSRRAVVLLSGDGGWRDFDNDLALALQKRGVSVIGWNSLPYFWAIKTPRAFSQDMNRVLAAYQQRWHIEQFALAGYSFGADVLPFAYIGLPQSMRDKIGFLSLLGFEDSADFKIRIGGWLGWGNRGTRPVMPVIHQMDPRMIQCVYGEEEKKSSCDELRPLGAQIVERAGGHHFDGKPDALAASLLAGWELRSHSSKLAPTVNQKGQ